MNIFYIIATPVGKLISLIYSFTNNYILSVFLCVFAFDIFLIWFDIIKRKSENKLEIIVPQVLELDKKYPDRKKDEKQKQKYDDEIVKLYDANNYTGASVFILPIVNTIISIMFFIAIASPLHFISGLDAKTITEIGKFLNSSGFSFRYTMQLQIVSYINQNGLGLLAEKFPELLTANIPNLSIFGLNLGMPASFTNLSVIFPIITIGYSLFSTAKELKNKIDFEKLKKFEMSQLPALLLNILPIFVSVYFSLKFSVLMIVYTIFTTGTRTLKTLVVKKVFSIKEKGKENKSELTEDSANLIS